MTTVTLYTRPGCHLCAEAKALVEQAGRGLAVALHEVNIDAGGEAVRARYTDRVPVLAAGQREIDWPFTLTQARGALTAALPG